MRLSHAECEENFATKWFPRVEADMRQMVLKNKARLVHYMLFAKYSKQEQRKDKLQTVLGDEYLEIYRQAQRVWR